MSTHFHVNKDFTNYLDAVLTERNIDYSKTYDKDDTVLYECQLSLTDAENILKRAYCERKSETDQKVYVTEKEMDDYFLIKKVLEKYRVREGSILEEVPMGQILVGKISCK